MGGSDMKRLSDRDVLAGALFIFIGAVFAATSLTYRVGTPANMGPGLFPLGLALLLTGLGLSLVVKSLRKQHPTGVGRIKLRAVLPILGAVAVFAFALEPLGLALTVALLVIAALVAAGPVHWPTALATAAALSGLSVLIFVVALSMPINILPWPFR